MSSSTKSVRPASMAGYVREAIESDMHNGRLLPGDALDELHLCERFNVSRTPVREALLQLQAQGLVRIVPRSGIYVARLSLPELFAMYELLAELEGVCAKFAALRMTRSEVAQLRAVHEEAALCRDQKDPECYAIANTRFHQIIYEGCHNPFLKSQVELIRKRTHVYRQNVFENTTRIATSHRDHGRVVEAIEAGDAAAATREMLNHIGGGGRDFAEFLATSPAELFEPAAYARSSNRREASPHR
ncbi:GntR family transcriptional regulator [Pusillimonas noertemannii]|uniref:GntR family transcriptional regulator n=1 Tax=Pusillimonas noertemannii TaxID=305977 RepID=A0A2U1CKJ4_9BURK|nr:GntR family transcriptional regulator [Pusillimonas noertemannii]NYT69072.1 GntR family transcriptional regulator [Pusillimonas noertemannii]PVY61539.1 GntR family transcriptional regulator [Pusillimonas noertemannii]TFL09488.1 GntR family transcriptional regulator [Pusillimonas noertemannii]